jgi:hypothetical protein
MARATEVKRKKALRYTLALLALGALSTGCAGAREGYLYDSQAPRKGSVIFEDAAAKRGHVVAVLADGERCAGSFNTVPGIVQMDEETGQIAREESQTGLAILECAPKHIVRCGFQRDHGGAGYGHCSDNNGRNFDLYF